MMKKQYFMTDMLIPVWQTMIEIKQNECFLPTVVIYALR